MKDTDRLRLGIVAGDLASRSEEGHIITNVAVGRLLDAIYNEFSNVRVCLPVLPKPRSVFTYTLQIPFEKVVALPPLETTIEAQKYYFQTKRIIRHFSQESDLLLLRLPFQLPGCLVGLKKPKVLQVVSNPYNIVKFSDDYKGLLSFLARGFARYQENSMRKAVEEINTRTITHGQEMWDVLNCKAGRKVVSSSLFANEILPKKKFDLHNPPRLLFVGYLRPEKGVETLLDAFTIARKKRDLKLTLVGGKDRSTVAGSLIRAKIEQNPFKDDIDVRGYLDFGKELFEQYRSHDIYILPSLSEGTPRTLVEARCFGCPVIATNVGGVSSSVTDGEDGILISPENPEAMAAAIEKLLDDDVLRRQLIDRGLYRCRDFTLENFVSNIVEELKLAAKESGLFS